MASNITRPNWHAKCRLLITLISYVKVKVINMIKEIEAHTRSDRCCCHESLMAQNIHPMLTQCWSNSRDAMLAYRLMNQNKVNSCLHICLLFVGPV